MRQARADAVKESSIEDYFVRSAKKWNCLQRKITQFYAPDGWPDRVCIWADKNGTTDWVELKRPKGGRYSERQLQVHEDLRTRNVNVACLHTKNEVDAYFEERGNQLGVARLKPGSKAGLAKLKKLQAELLR